MDIPIRTIDESETPWSFQMAFDEREQLTTKVAGLLQPSGISLGALSVDVEESSVSVSVNYNGEAQPPISIAPWRPLSPGLTVFPANYIADKTLEFFGLPGTP